MNRFLPSARRFIATALVVLHLAALLVHGLSQTAQAADDLAKRAGGIVICTLQGVMLLNPADGTKQPLPSKTNTATHCVLCLIPANIATPPAYEAAAFNPPSFHHKPLRYALADGVSLPGTVKRSSPPRAPPVVV
jgi:hypothetical protein